MSFLINTDAMMKKATHWLDNDIGSNYLGFEEEKNYLSNIPRVRYSLYFTEQK